MADRFPGVGARQAGYIQTLCGRINRSRNFRAEEPRLEDDGIALSVFMADGRWFGEVMFSAPPASGEVAPPFLLTVRRELRDVAPQFEKAFGLRPIRYLGA